MFILFRRHYPVSTRILVTGRLVDCMNLSGQTALVTGGAGFVGSHLVEALVSRGNEVVVVDSLSTGRAEALPEDVELIEATLLPTERRVRSSTHQSTFSFISLLARIRTTRIHGDSFELTLR